MVIPLRVGAEGPEVLVQRYVLIDPSGSEATAVSVVEEVGRVMVTLLEATTTGGWLMLVTLTVTSSLAVAPILSVTVILKT